MTVTSGLEEPGIPSEERDVWILRRQKNSAVPARGGSTTQNLCDSFRNSGNYARTVGRTHASFGTELPGCYYHQTFGSVCFPCFSSRWWLRTSPQSVFYTSSESASMSHALLSRLSFLFRSSFASRRRLRSVHQLRGESLEPRCLLSASPRVKSFDVSGDSIVKGSASWTLQLTEPVTGVDSSDFQVIAGEAVTWQSMDVMGSGSNWIITVSGLAGYGNLKVELIDDGSIRDSDGNPIYGDSFISLEQVTVPGTALNYRDMLVSDFDGDGRDEIVFVESLAGGRTSRLVRMDMDANGASTKTEIPLLLKDIPPIRILKADITGDGRAELLVAEVNGVFEVFALEAHGETWTMFSGSLPTENGTPIWDNPGGAVFGDFTGDGLTDMVLEYSSYKGRWIQVLQGNYEGQFSRAQFIPLTGSQFNPGIRTLLSDDLNGDGFPDLLFDDYTMDADNNLVGRSRVLLGSATGELLEAGVYPGRDNKAGMGKLFDVDGDQQVDWIAFDADLGLCVFPGLGNGNFGGPQPVGFRGDERIQVNPLELVVVPDSGPLADLVLFSVTKADTGNILQDRTRVTRFHQSSPGRFELSSELDMEGQLLSLLPFEKPNLQEAFTSEHGFELRLTILGKPAPYRTSTFNRINLAGELPLSSTLVTTLPGVLVQSADGDFDGDGVTDTVVTTANAGPDLWATDLTILLRNSPQITESPIREAFVYAEPDGNEPTFVLAADANSDGQLDVLSVGPTANTLNFHRGLGEGFFAPNQRITVGAGPVGVVAGDFDADGYTDVVTANSQDGSLSILRGRAGGILEPQGDVPVGLSPQSILTADFNQDDCLDVIVALAGENSLAILYGTPLGNFTTPARTSLSVNPSQIGIADLNSDGRPDVVAAGLDIPGVQVLFGSPDGLQHGAFIVLSEGVQNLLLEDLNGDGRADLLMLLDNSKQLLIATGLGGGEFSVPELMFYYYSGTEQIALGELNGAGPDLISLNAFTNSFFDFRTDVAPGMFSQAEEQHVDHLPRAFAVADFTGDGRDDLVAADFYKDGLRLFRNTSSGAARGPNVVVVENLPPTHDPLETVVFPEDTREFRVPVTGISPGLGEAQFVRLVVYYSDNPDLIPTPEFVLGENQSSGEFILHPRPLKSGTATVYFYLEDAGPDGDFATFRDNGYSPVLQPLQIVVNPIRATISSPSGVFGEQRPDFFWSDVPGATEYRVWISNASTGAHPVLLTTVPYNFFVPEVDLGIGHFDFWVQAVQANGKRLPWSFRKSFEIATAVKLAEIPRRVPNPRVSVTWAAVPGADSYEVYLSDLSTGTPGAIREVVTSNSWIPAIDLGLSRWRIWVRAMVSGRYQAWWSSPADFTVVAPPEPVGPSVFSTQQMPAFQWSNVAGADRYGFQLRNAVTGRVVIDVRGLTSPTFTPETPLALGRYRWWSIAESTVTGVRSEWSTGVDLVISDRPVLLSPTGSVSSQNPKLIWMAFPGAVSYEVWVTRMQPLQFVVSASGVTQTEWSVPIALTPGAPHRFWIRAVTSDNRTTAWSQYLEFTVADAEASGATDQKSLLSLADVIELDEALTQLAWRSRPAKSIRSRTQFESAHEGGFVSWQEPELSHTKHAVNATAAPSLTSSRVVTPADEFPHEALLDQAIVLAIADLDRGA